MINERHNMQTNEYGPEARETLRVGDGVARALLRDEIDADAATSAKIDALEARIIERARRAGMTEQQIHEALRR
jgi:hypothetical protein